MKTTTKKKVSRAARSPRPTALKPSPVPSDEGRIDLVYKYGTITAVREQDLTLQLLGQAWLYREDLRRAYNAERRIMRQLYALLHTDDVAHVIAYERSVRRERLNGRLREVRAGRGHLIDHGTYWLLEEAMQQANVRSVGSDPLKSQPWEEIGRIGAAIMSSEKFLIESEDGFTHKRVSLGKANERQIAELEIRIGEAKAGRSLHWSVKMHRPLPAGAIVKRIAMQRLRSGHRYRWEMLATISVPASSRPCANDTHASGVVGIDLGWRVEDKRTLRVATVSGSEGGGDHGAETFALLIDTLDAFEYASSVRGFRDQAFDAAKEYVASQHVPGGEHARLWRDKERMMRLAKKTGELGANWWRERDRHLEDIECGVRSRAIRRRLDTYRSFAARLAARYQYAALEDMPMSAWVGEAATHAKEAVRNAASLSLLQDVIAERFGAARTIWVPAKNTSRMCSECGVVHPSSVGPAPLWSCTGCGTEHHQDVNAAANLRHLGERWIASGDPLPARTRRSKAKKPIDGVAVGDRTRMTVTPRESADKAAE